MGEAWDIGWKNHAGDDKLSCILYTTQYGMPRQKFLKMGVGGNFVLMQYTGLKDKNGKEIYEGDILKHDLWGLTEIIWEHGMFRGTNGKEWNEMIDVTLADHQLKRCKIVGNKYENPSLVSLE